MFTKFIDRIVSKSMAKALKERNEVEDANRKSEVRQITKDICREMVVELFTSKKENGVEMSYWGDHHTITTVVGNLKDGIKGKVIAELTEEERHRAMKYIKGESFIDSVVERIQKKQLI